MYVFAALNHEREMRKTEKKEREREAVPLTVCL